MHISAHLGTARPDEYEAQRAAAAAYEDAKAYARAEIVRSARAVLHGGKNGERSMEAA